MGFFAIASILMVLVSIFGYFNVRYLKLQNSIGIMIVSIIFSLGILLISTILPGFIHLEKSLVGSIDFSKLLLNGLLCFMIFAGSLHVNINELKSQRAKVIVFSVAGTLLSTVIVGILLYYTLQWVNMSLPLLHCFIFGALISPTDPVSVMGILRKVGILKSTETTIVGESLFNDGVGVVVFTTLLQLSGNDGMENVQMSEIILHILKEIGGGFFFGFLLGSITNRALKKIDDYEVEVLITLAMVMGGYSLALWFGFSGAITMVVAGLIIGNRTYEQWIKKDEATDYVGKFWKLTDILANAILFVLIGLEIVLIPFSKTLIISGLAAIIVVILSRFVSVSFLFVTLKKWLPFNKQTIFIMTWGGLRGGISIAIALSLSKSTSSEIIIPITYIVVLFSIIVQGLSLEKAVGWMKKSVNNTTS